jgi:tyrosyl-tRNA synthetase
MNTADDDIERFLKILTMLDLQDIEKVVSKHRENAELRL